VFLTGKLLVGEETCIFCPQLVLPGGKRKAKLFFLKSRRRAKSEGLRDVPAADKGGEGARSWLEAAGRVAMDFVLIVPFLAWKQREKGGF